MLLNSDNIILLTYFLMLIVAVVQFRTYIKILNTEENSKRYSKYWKILTLK